MNENDNAAAPIRPGVVTAAAVLIYVFAGIGILGSLVAFGLSSSMPGSFHLVALVNLGLYVAFVALATMILGGSNRAKTATIVLLSISIGFDVIGFGGGSLFSIALALLVIGLLAWNRDAAVFFAATRR